MKVRLLGLGAVGAPIARCLDPVCDFAILLSGDRVERYRREGCTINGTRHDFAIATEAEDDVDLIIVACKNTDLAGALSVIEPHVGEKTAIMSLLNGIESERVLGERFGEEKIIYSFITNLSSVREGRAVDLFSPRGGLVKFNEKDGNRTERIDAIDRLFTEASIWHEVPSDIIHDIWWKFSFNIIVNSLSAAMDLDYAHMNGNPAFYRLVRMIYKEIRSVAAAEGIVLSEADEELCFTVLANMDGVGKTSMCQDVEAGRETENAWFAGSLSALGKRHSLSTPLCDFLYNLVEAAR